MSICVVRKGLQVLENAQADDLTQSSRLEMKILFNFKRFVRASKSPAKFPEPSETENRSQHKTDEPGREKLNESPVLYTATRHAAATPKWIHAGFTSTRRSPGAKRITVRYVSDSAAV